MRPTLVITYWRQVINDNKELINVPASITLPVISKPDGNVQLEFSRECFDDLLQIMQNKGITTRIVMKHND